MNDIPQMDYNEVDSTIVRGNIAEIKYMLEHDAEFFIEFFMAEELEFEVPWIHKEIFSRMTNRDLQKMLLAIPRGHAKTTLAKLAVMWYFLFSPYRFCVYLSNTSPIAKNACRDIVGFLANENFQAVFGKARMLKESETDGLWIFELPRGNGKVKKCILRSAGANQQMRGINVDHQRPDITVADDLEDLANTKSETLQKNLDEWVFGTYIKALARNYKLIWIGNMLSVTSILYRLSQLPEFNPIVFGCLITNPETGKLEPLWPDFWPMDKIRADFKLYQTLGLIETWMCEMMNLPGQGANGFTSSQITYRPIPDLEDLEGTFITIDPAFGLDAVVHDKSAVVVHGMEIGYGPRVLGYYSGRLREHELFRETLKLARQWKAWVWGMESAAQQRALITLFKVYAIEAMEEGIEIVELNHGGRAKAARISAWVSAMEKNLYAIPADDLDITTQLLKYDKSIKDQEDDLIDGCAYGLDMLENNLGLIYASFARDRNGESEAKAVYGTGVCGV